MVTAFEPRRELRAASAAADIDHQVACNFGSATMVCNLADKVQHQIDSGGDPGAAVATAVFNEESIFKDLRIRGSQQQFCAGRMMCRTGAAIQQSGTPRQ